MTTPLLCIDSGLRDCAHHVATDRLWLSRHAQGRQPAILRFHRSRPAVSVGLHQAIDRELRLDYCRARAIEVVRRPSGGGALYLDEQQLGFSLVLRRPAAQSLEALLRRACDGVAQGLAALGIASRFKFPNDLEVAGAKLASVFVAADGGSVLLHGTVLLEADIRTMLEALRAPTEKLSPDGLAAARDRLATLSQCLGREPSVEALQAALRDGLAATFGLAPVAGEPPPLADAQAVDAEVREALRIDWSAPDQPWVEAVSKSPGATLRLRARFDADGRRLAAAEFSGDLACDPPGLPADLSRALTGVPVGLAQRCADEVLAHRPLDAVGVGSEDLLHLLHLAVDKQRMRRHLDVAGDQANAVMVFSPGEPRAMQEILHRAEVMLVPYCAKPAWCKWRHLDGCTECGLCEVGTAYRLARERRMRVVSVTNYEHLVTTLGEMKSDGTAAYVGMCCSNFYLKRHRAFSEAGMPAVLMDISGANCYELRQEDQAYAGQFKAEAKLDADLLVKVMKFVPPRG